jgi:hypothetical protein
MCLLYTYTSQAEYHVILYVTCITIIDTIILTNYTNDAYTYDTYIQAEYHVILGPFLDYANLAIQFGYAERKQHVSQKYTIIDTIIHHIHTYRTYDAYTYDTCDTYLLCLCYVCANLAIQFGYATMCVCSSLPMPYPLAICHMSYAICHMSIIPTPYLNPTPLRH